MSKFFTNQKVNLLAKDKATLNRNSKWFYNFETDCGKIHVKFKKTLKLKIALLQLKSNPCSDLLIGIYEDIRINLGKTSKIKETKGKIIFLAKKDTLMVFNKEIINP